MNRPAWTVIVPALFLFYPCDLAWGQKSAAPLSVSGCLQSPLARLKDSERCRASYPFKPSGSESATRLCIDSRSWERLLAERTFGSCARWSGNWKSESPLRNFEAEPPKIPETVFYVRSFETERVNSGGWLGILRSKIERLRERISLQLAPHDPWGIFRALVLSESPGSETPDPRLLRLLGFVHLLSASGIHLYVLARIWNSALLFLFLNLNWEIRKGLWASRIMTGAQILFCWALCGLRTGLLRPWLVLFLRGTAEAAGFRWRKWSPLLATILIEAVHATWASQHSARGTSWSELMQGGLLYSLAVGGGLAVSGTGVASHVRLAIAAWVFSAIWEIWHEGLTALLTPLVSLATIPVISVLLYPVMTASALWQAMGFPGTYLQSTFLLGVELGQKVVSLLMGWVLSISDLWVISRSALIGAVMLVLLHHIVGASRIRTALSSIVVFALLLRRSSANAGGIPPGLASQVQQLDVGQGDAALVLSDDHRAGLIDSGSSSSLSDSAWLKLLASRGITRIDWVLLTHLDQDHSGGLERLARLLPVSCAVISEGELSSPRGKKYEARLARLGIRIADTSEGCIPFPVLLPPVQAKHVAKRNSNMSAILIPLKGGGFYLSAGDADASDEPRIGKWASLTGANLGTPRILKISHHGSRFSSASEFLDQVQPTEAWISVGNGNTYGHPSIQVLEKLSLRAVPFHRTDLEGYIHIK